MLRRAKSILQTNDFTALYDKGYHTGSELKTAIEAGVHVMVAMQAVAAFAPNDAYNFDKFIYNQTNDTYTCPRQKTLVTNGNWYQKSKQRYIYFVKHYKTNKKNIQANPLVYKQRQSIIEHNYGILKRQWGFYYISTKKGIIRASADVGLMFCAYNLRRIINLVDKNLFKKFLRDLWLSFFGKL